MTLVEPIMLGVLLCVFLPLATRAYFNLVKTQAEDAKRTATRLAVLETKQNILMEHAGYDIRKVDQAIQATSSNPEIGCLRLSELRRDDK